MPFRKTGLPRRISHLLLPATSLIVLLGVATWVLWALSITPASKITPGVILLILGFAGTPVITLIVGAMIVAVLEGVMVEVKSELVEEIRSAAIRERTH